jgi:hypothetical protein
MISALVKGKMHVDEDKVTSSVFDNILHLPDDMIWQIIRKSCYDNSILPINAGALLVSEFFPHWNSESTGNEDYVEPDLFLSFENINIVIEAKREYNKQGIDQWKREIQAYNNKCDNKVDKIVVLLAIDGIDNEDNVYIEELKINVVKTRWAKIFLVIKKYLNEIKSLKCLNINNIIRTLSLISDYLIFHGYYEKTWMNEIFTKEISFINFDAGISIFQKENNGWFNTIVDKSFIIDYYDSINLLKKMEVNYGKH